MPQPDLEDLSDAATELMDPLDQRRLLAEGDELSPLYDALSDRLLTLEEAQQPVVVDPLERLGRRLWLGAVATLIVIGVLAAGALAGAVVLP